MADNRVGTLRALRRNRNRAAADVAVIDQLARLQRNRLNHIRRRIGRGFFALTVTAFMADAVVAGGLTNVGRDALARHLDVIQLARVYRQRIARHHLAFIVEHLIGVHRHIAARDDLSRIAFGNLGLLHRTGVVILGEAVVVAAGFARRVEVAQRVSGVAIDKDALFTRFPAHRITRLLILSDRLRGNGRQFGAEMIVDVIDLSGGKEHIARRLDGRAVVVDGIGLAGRQPVGIQFAAQRHIPCAVDQAVIAVVQRLDADIDPLASGQRGGGAVFRQVIEDPSLHAHRIAVDTAAADIG